VAGENIVPIFGRNEPVLPRKALRSLFESTQSVFIKPSDGGQGDGAFQVTHIKGGIQVNGQLMGSDEFDAWLRDLPLSFTISDVIEQSKWASRISPAAVNTVRIMTATSFDDYRIVILGAALKCATTRSQPTDNFSQGHGGLSAGINLESGLLGQAVSFDEESFKRVVFDCHPETGAQISGEILPDWCLLRETISRLAGLFPSPGIAGWDVALREDGITVVEINTLPGIDVLQSSTGLLDTEPKRRILREMRLC